MDIEANVNCLKVGYVFDKKLLCLVNKIPPIEGRALIVHQLIKTYNLLPFCHQIIPKPACEEELRSFHSSDYLDFIKKVSENKDNPPNDDECEWFGLNYDCPPFDDLYATIAYLAGSSISAAQAIINKQCQIVINWFGGWHHGHRDEASGFCYTNDIVFAIMTFLQNGFNRIVYIDLDLHHGNGVEEAFAHTDKVLTLSLHKYEFGFFPGTGSIDDIGQGNKGRYYSINMPISDGINDEQYTHIFDTIIEKLIPKYNPQVIICQCGADTLSGDRMKSFNLTLKSYENCIEKLLSYNLPLLLMGGGGYNPTNTAKLWTTITGKLLGKSLDVNIPDHEFFLLYKPDYELTITSSLIPNQNRNDQIDENLKIILKNIEKIN